LAQFGDPSISHKYLSGDLHWIMMVKEKTAQLVVPTFLLMILMVAPCFSLPRIAGVHKGEFYRYADISLSWNFNQPIPSFIANITEIRWSSITILDVYQETVMYESTVQFKNGSATHENITGSVNSNNPSWIIATNLRKDDVLYNDSSRKAWINETLQWMYSGGQRNINHVQLVSLGSADEIQYTITNDWYFDQLTGMTVEYSLEFVNTTESYAGTGRYETKLVESNAWTIPEFPLFLMPPLFILITLLTATVYRRRHSFQRPVSLRTKP
jgi:hypothetical protein